MNSGVESAGIEESLGKSERIGVIGSPSSTSELAIDILETAVVKNLVGKFCVFRYTQDDKDNYALGQITEVSLRNLMSEDPTIRGLIRQKGKVDPVTERQDAHAAKMITSAVFSRSGGSFEPSRMGTVPATGTSLSLLDDGMLESFMKEYQDDLFYVGKVYGSEILLPTRFRHFAKGKGGADEAYHIGVFGKTGSGKSWLSKMVIMGYAAHQSMSILVLDPQGEFSALSADKSVCRKGSKRTVEVFGLHNVALVDSRSFDLFKKILKASDFFDGLGIFNAENKDRAANEAIKAIQRKGMGEFSGERGLYTFSGQAGASGTGGHGAAAEEGADVNPSTRDVSYSNVYEKRHFKKFWNALKDYKVLRGIYTTKEPQERVLSNRNAASENAYYEKWASVGRLFASDRETETITLTDLVKKVADEQNGSIVIIDLADAAVPKEMFWGESVRFIVINEILDKLKSEAEEKYREGKSLNTLVVADEAHRIAPNERTENAELKAVKSTLIDAVRTTRKYGLGWMFISQTLASLDREIRSQIGVWLFGFGLGWGSEYRTLREIIGGADEAIKLYQSFRDPQSTLGDFKQYPFMGVGPISPLSFSDAPLFFTALNYPEEFRSANG